MVEKHNEQRNTIYDSSWASNKSYISYSIIIYIATLEKWKELSWVNEHFPPKVARLGLVWALLGGRCWPMLCEGEPYIAQVIGKQTAADSPPQPPPPETEIKIHPKPAPPSSTTTTQIPSNHPSKGL